MFLRKLVTEEFFPVSSNLGRKTEFIQQNTTKKTEQKSTRVLVKAFKKLPTLRLY